VGTSTFSPYHSPTRRPSTPSPLVGIFSHAPSHPKVFIASFGVCERGMPPKRQKSASNSTATATAAAVDTKVPQPAQGKKRPSYVCCRVFLVTFGTHQSLFTRLLTRSCNNSLIRNDICCFCHYFRWIMWFMEH